MGERGSGEDGGSGGEGASSVHKSCAVCEMPYLNDGPYLPGDVAQELKPVRKVQKNNVELFQTQSLQSWGWT